MRGDAAKDRVRQRLEDGGGVPSTGLGGELPEAGTGKAMVPL